MAVATITGPSHRSARRLVTSPLRWQIWRRFGGPRHPPTSTIHGYRGKHLELTVPNIDLTECIGSKLKSWIAPPYGAFYGYTGPGYAEEFWILDVEGSRLVIAAERSPVSPAKDIAEMRTILDSIRIEP